MSFGILLNNLELSEYPLNHIGSFAYSKNTSRSYGFPEFAKYEILAIVEPIEALPITEVYSLASVTVSGTTVIARGGTVNCYIHVFGR